MFNHKTSGGEMKKFLVLFIISISALYSAIINVPEDYSSIQVAIENSTYLDTVLIANGTYNESIDFLGKQITVASNFIISGNENDISNTIIDAQMLSNHVVSFVNDEESDSKLIGLSITGGNAEGEDNDERGGGIFISGSSPVILPSPTIEFCHIYGNSANVGAGISLCAFVGSVNISNCKIYDNHAKYAAGIYLGSILENATVSNCEIFNNQAAFTGGAIINFARYNKVKSTKIYGNRAGKKGSAITASSGMSIDRTLIYNNECDSASVIELKGSIPTAGQRTVITNSSIVDNFCQEDYSFDLSGSAELVIVNSIIANENSVEIYSNDEESENEVTIAYSNIPLGEESVQLSNTSNLVWEESNISADPLFVDSENYDYHLQENSPCIDNGTASYILSGFDIIGYEEDDYTGSAPDMGFLEFEGLNSLDDNAIGHNDQLNLSLFPNPFNPNLQISYTLEHASNISVDIYNIKGQKVSNLYSGMSSEGVHSLNWHGTSDNGEDVTSGIYFVKVKSDFSQNMKKITLMK
jgi:hypothetical protein